MSRGICGFLWQLSVALYLFANGVLGLQGGSRLADRLSGRGGFGFREILSTMFKGDALNFFVIVVSVIALIAGIAILLEMFSVELPFLNPLVLVVAIVWVVYIIISLIAWITGGNFIDHFFPELAKLAVNVMVLASLLTASKRFE